jgi:hypothetical protein
MFLFKIDRIIQILKKIYRNSIEISKCTIPPTDRIKTMF